MKSTNKNLLRFLSPIAAGLALATAPAQAASISYLLQQSNALPDGTSYLQVTVADGMDGAIDFTVQLLGPLTGIADDNFGMDSFAFNVVSGGDAEAMNITGLPDGWRAGNGKRFSGFGLFDIALKGRGSARQETLTFSITGVEGDTPADYAILSTGFASEDNQFFSAHVGGFLYGECDRDCDDDVIPQASRGGLAALGNNGRKPKMLPLWMRDWQGQTDQNWDPDWVKDCLSSGFFGGSTAVPLPATAWLLGAGLAGVMVRARKRRA